MDNFKKEKAIIYQIFLRMLTPEGTIKSAQRLIPHFANLGVNILYLCPVFSADEDKDTAHWSKRQKISGLNNPKNPYRIKDYFDIDFEYGTKTDLRDFINEAHKKKLRVVLDLVYLHCGPKAVFIDSNPNFVKRDNKGEIIFGEWNFPLLNFESQGLREYLINNMEYYIKEFNIDGYRCDVGDQVPLDFWHEALKRIKKLKSDIFMLNEGFNKEYVKDVFDLNYNWVGGYSFYDFLIKKDCKFLKKNHDYLIQENQAGKTLNYIENHDTAYDWALRADRMADSEFVDLCFVYIFTMDGVPFVYNGNEVADGNKHNLYANRYYSNNSLVDWSQGFTEQGKRRFSLIKKLSHLRVQNEPLFNGSVEFLDTPDNKNACVYLRRSGSEGILIILNFGVKEISINHTIKNILLSRKTKIMKDESIYVDQYGFFIGNI